VLTGRRSFTAKTRRREGNTDYNNKDNNKDADVHRFSQFLEETDPAEGSATGDLRDLRVLCGGKNTGAPDTEFSTGRGVRFFATEDTEVTEALGSLASHTAGLRIRYNHLSFGFTQFRGSPRIAAAGARDGSKRHSPRSVVPSHTADP
jgi:hypothetical protein